MGIIWSSAEMQKLRPHPRLTDSAFSKIPRWSVCTLKFKKEVFPLISGSRVNSSVWGHLRPSFLLPFLPSHAASSYKVLSPDSWTFSNAAPQGAWPSLEMVLKAESRKKLSRQESRAEAKDLVKGRPGDGPGVGRGCCQQSTVRRGGSGARGDGQRKSQGKWEQTKSLN